MLFNDYLEQMKNTPLYEAARARDEITNTFMYRMREVGITKTDLARKMKVTPAYITRLVCGDGPITLASMAKIAFALGGRLRITFEPLTTEHKAEADQ